MAAAAAGPGAEVDMDAIEAHTRVAVPAYGRIYVDCATLIGARVRTRRPRVCALVH
jgi:hypothetical protein